MESIIAPVAVHYNQVANRIPYRYSSLLPGRNSIRLLRVMPNKDATAPIKCQLFDYSLDSDKGIHLYEAISYVWGDPDKTRPIFIGKYYFKVTENLYSALLHLRNNSIERIIWVDAVCINQANEQEKAHQIQSMTKIYGLANRVIVWLGETADNSHQALEAIRIAASRRPTDSLNYEMIQYAILNLLKRPWFRRIWVVQEIAVARNIQVVCGSTDIDGYAFCVGLESFKEVYTRHPGLQGPLYSVTHMIHGAIFRPKYANKPGRVSLDITLGELIDMYHTHEATKYHDKVYALLGMSSDDLSKANLLPDYGVPWKEVLQRLIKFLLYERVFVKTWNDRQMAVIKSKGCLIGKIASVVRNWDGRQNVNILFKSGSEYLGYNKETINNWTLQASANPIQKGDLVCLLQRTSKPTIIRLNKDHFTVVMIAAIPEAIKTDNRSNRLPELSQSVTDFPHDFLLVWNWEIAPGKFQNRGECEALEKIEGPGTDLSKEDVEKAARLSHVAMILIDTEDYKGAEERFREAIKNLERANGKEHPHTLTGVGNLALLYKRTRKFKQAEGLLIQVIQTRRRVQGQAHPDTLNSMTSLASIYKEQGYSEKEKKQEMMVYILSRVDDHACIAEQAVVQIARTFDKEVIMLLLGRRENSIQITEKVVVQIIARFDGDVIKLLLDRKENDIQVTEEVVKAAAENSWNRKEIMMLLLNRRENGVKITEEAVVQIIGTFDKEVMMAVLGRHENSIQITEEVVLQIIGTFDKEVIMAALDRQENSVQITEEVVVQIARRFDRDVMKLLLDRRENDIQVTIEVVKAAAGNPWNGKEVMMLLLNRRENDIQITEEVVKAAAGNSQNGKAVMMALLDCRENDIQVTKEAVVQITGMFDKEVMMLLLNRRKNDVQVIEEAVVQIAGRFDGDVMKFLLDQTENNIQVTEEVVKAAAGNPWNGKEVMVLLLNRRENDIQITEEVVKAAAGNSWNGKEVIALLLDRRGNDIQITEEVIKAAAGNWWNGEAVMTLLLDQRENDFQATEEIVKAAAGNWWSGKKIMALLLDRSGSNIEITDIIKATAGK